MGGDLLAAVNPGRRLRGGDFADTASNVLMLVPRAVSAAFARSASAISTARNASTCRPSATTSVTSASRDSASNRRRPSWSTELSSERAPATATPVEVSSSMHPTLDTTTDN